MRFQLKRHESFSQLAAGFLLGAGLLLRPAFLSAQATNPPNQNLEIFIDSEFVQRDNPACIAVANTGGGLAFQCPPNSVYSGQVSGSPCENSVRAGGSFVPPAISRCATPPTVTLLSMTNTSNQGQGGGAVATQGCSCPSTLACNCSVPFPLTSFSNTSSAATLYSNYTITTGVQSNSTLASPTCSVILTGESNSTLSLASSNCACSQATSTSWTCQSASAIVTSSTSPINGSVTLQTNVNGTSVFQFGNISNDPEIQFDQEPSGPATSAYGSDACFNRLDTLASGAYPLAPGDVAENVCNDKLFLCASIGFNNTSTGGGVTPSEIPLDFIQFDVFKYLQGADPTKQSLVRTYFIDSPPGAVIPAGGDSQSSGPLGPFCVLWDGSYNLNGQFGKSNGQYGFNVTVQVNQVGSSGNIQLTANRAYPAGSTFDANGNIVSQQPVTVSVTDGHSVTATPTLVGQTTPIPAEPYNIAYRLSQDATTYLNVTSPNGTVISGIVPGLPRIGEGFPSASTQVYVNGDPWYGRESNGDLAPPGVYLLSLQALSQDQYGADLSVPSTFQMSIDPLQITDVGVGPLTAGATSLASLSYTLTESATVYIDIYPPQTQFCNDGSGNPSLLDVNNPVMDQGSGPPKNFSPSLGGCPPAQAVSPIRSIYQFQQGRTSRISIWDGRDNSGNTLPDGNYVFVMYAALPSQNGFGFLGSSTDKRIWTSTAKTGFIPVSRGLVAISQVVPTSAIIGSSPAISGLNPFNFSYTLSRPSNVTLKIYDVSGQHVVKTLVNNEQRPSTIINSETWIDATGDNGYLVSSGTYMAQLSAADPLFPTQVSTTTALFPVDLFRITNVQVQPLLSNTSAFATVSYELSQNMNVALNVYPPGTVILNSSSTWPPCGALTAVTCGNIVGPGGTPVSPIYNVIGIRGGRLSLTEFWNGRDANGLIVPDGNYVFTLVAQSTGSTGGSTYFATDHIYGPITVERGPITFPNFDVEPTPAQVSHSSETILLPPFTVQYSMVRDSSVTINILSTSLPTKTIKHLVVGDFEKGNILQTQAWQGLDDAGNIPPNGFYTVQIQASDPVTQLETPATVEATVSVNPLRIYDVAASAITLQSGSAQIFYRVSFPMKTAVKIYKPGTTFDAFANPNPPESASLVKFLVGSKPALAPISDNWDGTDQTLEKVPDGDYLFSIVGSTDSNAISGLNGDVTSPSELAFDRPIFDIPVTRNGSLNPKADFEENTFAYPNPASGPTATFHIYTPFQADVKMAIYNVAGQLIRQQDFGTTPPSYTSGPVVFVWNKDNQAGRGVAAGIYYAVIRLEQNLNGSQVLQTVKKVLIP